jgi:hypothetical protein
LFQEEPWNQTEASVFMPGAADTMTLALSQRHRRAELSIPMEVFLDGGFHDQCILCQRPASMLASIE